VDPVGDGGGEGPEEIAGDPAGGLLVQLDEGELAGAVDGDEQGEAPSPGLQFAETPLCR
jgi:hypothetical protein